ncbi:MAG: TldD/PmbA family protein [Ardenticatenales bacterium]|nr:TldD/PmbA family protein [Ardenticatenales bacterium]
MQGIEQLRERAEYVLSMSPADETEVVLIVSDEQLTRFANNEVHQNVAETNVEVRVRVALGSRVGLATSNSLHNDALRLLIDNAIRLAQAQPENEEWPGLPEPGAPPTDVNGFAHATASASPRIRAEAVERVTRPAHQAHCIASGALSTAAHELVVANTKDLFVYYPWTQANFVTVAMGEGGTGSGYASATHTDINCLDIEALGGEAIRTAVASQNPMELEPGKLDVVLDSYAVADMVAFLATLGLNGAALVEKRSFATGRMGEKVTGEKVTLVDDGMAEGTLPMPIDFEGVTRQRLPLIEKGIVQNVAWDHFWARKGGTTSTGHALPAPNNWGPRPIHLHMTAGETPRADLIKGMKRGLLVTRFNYTRVVHPLKTIVTGLTRDGTFLVEDGQIVGPVKNLRFTENYLEALSRVEDISAERRLLSGFFGASLVPAVRIRDFTFTGKTQF